MTISHYRNFIAIVESGNILLASKKVHIAQPALSQQVRAMEREFGASLLLRGARGVTMTPAGKIFYQKAKAICELADAAAAEIANQQTGITGTLSIALPPTNAREFLSALFAKFTRKYPDVHIELYECTTAEAAERILNGTCEIGLIRAPGLNRQQFDILPLADERMVAAVPLGHPLEAHARICFSDLCGERLVVPRGWEAALLERCAELGCSLEISAVVTSYTATLKFADLANMVAIVPNAEDVYQVPTMKIFDFSDGAVKVPRAFITKKDRQLSVIAENFFKIQQAL